ncbi:MAG: transcriptional regulator [Candidatus Solibacter usitatus]|nr:transcriptional regulator [Candidatus Solibacter usitatus]
MGGGFNQCYAIGPFLVDPVKRLLFRNSDTVPLTSKVFEVLLVLIENRGKVLTKDELMKAVWPDTVVDENNLTRSISTLRKALGEKADEHRYVVTIPGRGYSFVAPVAVASAPPGQSPCRLTGPADAGWCSPPWPPSSPSEPSRTSVWPAGRACPFRKSASPVSPIPEAAARRPSLPTVSTWRMSTATLANRGCASGDWPTIATSGAARLNLCY